MRHRQAVRHRPSQAGSLTGAFSRGPVRWAEVRAAAAGLRNPGWRPGAALPGPGRSATSCRQSGRASRRGVANGVRGSVPGVDAPQPPVRGPGRAAVHAICESRNHRRCGCDLNFRGPHCMPDHGLVLGGPAVTTAGYRRVVSWFPGRGLDGGPPPEREGISQWNAANRRRNPRGMPYSQETCSSATASNRSGCSLDIKEYTSIQSTENIAFIPHSPKAWRRHPCEFTACGYRFGCFQEPPDHCPDGNRRGRQDHCGNRARSSPAGFRDPIAVAQ